MKKYLSFLMALMIACLTIVGPCVALAEPAAMVEYGADDLVNPDTRMSGIDAFLEGVKSLDGLTYQVGSRGTGVQEFQKLLIYCGYLPKGQADGMYGKKTAAAVEEFQLNAGLDITGEADVATQFLMVMIDGEFKQIGKNSVAQVENYAVVIMPEKGFYVGAVDKSSNLVQGTEYYVTGDYYAGEYKKNVRSGKGTAHFANGDVYVGDWKNDAMDGQGTYYFGGKDSNEYYVGHMTKNTMDGKGSYWLNGKEITGKWEKNKHKSWK